MNNSTQNGSDNLLLKRLLKMRALKNFAIGENGVPRTRTDSNSTLNDVIIEENSKIVEEKSNYGRL